jgi:PLP dependent protein
LQDKAFLAMDGHEDVVTRYQDVRHKMIRSLLDAGRKAHEASLIAVSKTVSPERIKPVLELGHQAFGENYVQEAKAKWPLLRQEHPNIELHHIGPLQSNKALDAVQLYDVIQTLDRASLAEALAKAIQKTGRAPQLFIQVNVGEEPQKGGIMPADLEAFHQICQKDYGLIIQGLMAIPPVDQPPSPYFALLNKWAKRLDVRYLSMGMSGDYAQALQLSATHIRVGTAIFGAR